MVALAAFIAGAVKGCPGTPNRDAAETYLAAWSQHDYPAMYEALSTESREAISLDTFRELYESAERTATAVSLKQDGKATGSETAVKLPVTVTTRAFGTISQPLSFSFGDDGVAWRDSLLFPGLEENEELSRTIELPPRAPILSKGGNPLAKGPASAREHPLGDAMVDVTGVIDVADEETADKFADAGYEPGDLMGVSGLEFAFNARLGGQPGGTLSAVPADGNSGEGRTLGQGQPQRGKPLRTTIDPDLQNAAVAGLAGQSGGVAVLDARSGAIRALAGQAYSVLQPPGSTMKIVTAAAGLAAGQVKMDDAFPYERSGVADGRNINNAYEELCGGSFVATFAHSCNSVFAPLGMKIGEEKFTAISEGFGFNRPPAIFNREITALVDPPTPTVPQPGDYNNELGVSAIGQGKVQATPLLMASVAQTIANRGVSKPTPITREQDLGPELKPHRVVSAKVATNVTTLMMAVVESGTGFAAAVSGVKVAGKTGTAELGPSGEYDDEGEPILIEDAWFAAFAPARKPRLAVGVMLVDASGDGGTVAAPIAGAILATALG